MLPMRFFRNRVFAVGGLASLMMYAALFGALFLITQLLQTGLGGRRCKRGCARCRWPSCRCCSRRRVVLSRTGSASAR